MFSGAGFKHTTAIAALVQTLLGAQQGKDGSMMPYPSPTKASLAAFCPRRSKPYSSVNVRPESMPTQTNPIRPK